jgi:hypothetical protein
MLNTVERVDRLEDLMAQMLETTAQTSRELREFKEEMREAAARYEAERRDAEARAEKAAREAEARAEKMAREAEARAEKELREYKEARLRDYQKLQKQIGEIANKTGRLVEDMVAPGIPKIFRDITGLDESKIDYSSVRVKKRGSYLREFDVLIAGAGYVLVNETKSTLRPENLKAFHAVMRDEIRQFFPEYEAAKFIGVVSSLYVDESIVTLGNKLGLYVLGFGEDLLDVLNPAAFEPHYF